MHGLVDMPPRSSDHHLLPLLGRRGSVRGVSVIGSGGSVPGRCGSRLDPGAVADGADSLWSATTATAEYCCCCFCFKGAIDVVGVPAAVICTAEEATIVLPIVTQCDIEDSSVVTVTATSVAEVTIAVVGEAVRVRGLGDDPRSVAVPNRGYDGLESRLETLHQTLHMLKLHLHRTGIDVLIDIDVLTSDADAAACVNSCRGRDSGGGSMYS